MHSIRTAMQRTATLGKLRVALVAAWALSSIGAAPEHEAVVEVRVCSTDPSAPSEGLEAAMREHLSFSRLRVLNDCQNAGAPGSPGSPAVFWMRFERSAGHVVLVLETGGAERRTREIPWLGSPERALEKTSLASQVPALALLVENLLLEFREVQLLRAPSMQTDPVDVQPAPTWAPAPTADAAPVPLARPRPPARPVSVHLELNGGASIHAADSIAPLFGATAVSRWDRWGAFLALRAATDSAFSVEHRAFDTAEYGLVAGPRYVLLQTHSYWLAWDTYGVLRLSRYRRADVPDTSVKHWLDVGLGCEGQFGVHLSERSAVFARVGAQLMPTARDAEIQDGPTRTTGMFRFPLLAGVATTF